MKKWILAIGALAIIAGCSSTNESATKKTADTGSKKMIAFVTNNASAFWTIARKGTEKAQAELKDFTIDFEIPSEGSAADQKRVLDNLLAKGVVGVAVSPVDAKNQTPDLNTLAEKAVLVTQDSDAPDSKRVMYVGTDNVAAGEMAGEQLKKALPKGGKVMVFVGKADADNAKERYEGLQKAIAGSGITIIDLRTDDTDRVRAKQNVADTLVKYPDVAGLVGLWSYNGPAIANAVKEANMVGKVKIVCFDEEAETLAGVKDGTIFSTVVQQPFEFGYQSMMLVSKLVSGDKSVVPANKKLIVPTKVIDKSNVDDFSAKLKELTK